MEPADAVAVIAGEGVVVVMVAFAVSDKGDKEVIYRGLFAPVGFGAPGVGDGVHEPGEVVAEEEAEPPGDDEGAYVVVEEPACEEEDDGVAADHEDFVVFVLENDHGIFQQVRHDAFLDGLILL